MVSGLHKLVEIAPIFWSHTSFKNAESGQPSDQRTAF